MNLLSLFSGCGGMDIGFAGGFTCLKASVNEHMHSDWIESGNSRWVKLRRTDFTTVFANDIRADAKSAWVSYFSKSIKNADNLYRVGSIVDLVKLAKAGEKVFPDNIDIVTGGFPCQDFSVAGKRKGFESDKAHNGKKIEAGTPSVENRGQLYMWMRDVIEITQPKLFVAENVKGLVNLNDVKEIIESDFSKAGGDGYLVVPARVLHVADYGVPQSRERVIFYGFKKSALNENALRALSQEIIPEEYDPYPPKTHAYTEEYEGLKPFVNCRQAFAGLKEPEISKDKSQQKYSLAKYLGKSCQGQTEIRLNSVGPTIRSEHHGNIEYRRLSLQHGGKNKKELNAGLPERRLTVRECARIQTFPDSYRFILKAKKNNVTVSPSDAYKLIGNAVPCVFAYNIAKRLSENWNLYFNGQENL